MNDFTAGREAVKAFRNELGSLCVKYSHRLSMETRKDLSTHDARHHAVQNYLGVRTLFHLIDDCLRLNEENPHLLAAPIWQMAANPGTMPQELREAIRRAHHKACADLSGHEGAKIHLSRRQIIVQGICAGAAGGLTFTGKTAYDINAHERAPKENPSPNATVAGNLLISGAAGMAGWHSGAIVAEWLPALNPYWEKLCIATGLPEPALKNLARGIELAQQLEKPTADIGR